MKIDDRAELSGSAVAAAKTAEAAKSAATDARRESAAVGSSSETSDHAELSGLAGKLAELTSVNSPDRTAQLEHLRKEVSSGQYSADATAVSQKIIQEALLGDLNPSGAE